ncbi:cupin domain-containing protein [Allomuricauda sp. NBRC 101325]|uniref:cupin domain-containing protein n=1 Tax=Allomuricauda sp. NBRC 101325 TaxID=1113758 RepID=UPI0024A15F15|nr:cupin domain-containing protein [Muricauda sp. NBRC 101325]GLU45154.1 cupin [Muricauda sp. NBRC 101325]
MFLIIGILASAQQNDTPIFPKGKLAPKENFIGQVWVTSLVTNDSIYQTVVASVTFEPGARTNWHSHPNGQLILVTDGVGYHQLEGTPKQVIQKGDIIKCPPHTNHWHGGSWDQAMTHIVVLPNTEKGNAVWRGRVTNRVYVN